jgi:RNA polymerase sigma factor (sigma-70 family)
MEDERSDEQLLEAWRAGDKRAGSALYARHCDRVRRFFANKIANPTDAEELIQNTWLACVKGRDRIEGTFRAYLLGTARKQCCKHWAGRTKRDVDIETLAIADLTDRPSSIVARDQTQRMLLDALRHLEMSDQMILELYFWEGLSGRELGEVMSMTEERVRGRLRSAREALRKAIRRRENLLGLPESTDENIQDWARGVRDLIPNVDDDDDGEDSGRS